ncbi:MAG TPA: EAL domain-containing protein [Noviherbaspirillum sp.]
MNNNTGRHRKNALRSPGGIVLLYALFSAVWIAGSDRTLAYLFPDPVQFERFSTLKGFLFIIVTGMLLYVLLRNWYGSLSSAMAASTLYRERLERVLRGSNDGWWDWNLKTGRIFCSPRCCEMLGYEHDALPSDTRLWRRLIHPDDAAKARRCFVSALRNESQSVSVELRLRHRDGHYIPVLSRYMAERNTDGTTLTVSGTGTDLSEQKRSEERLRQAAAVFETTREGVIIADAGKRILMVNNAFCQITGYAEEEVSGKSLDILRSGRHTPEFDSDVWNEIAVSGHWQGEVWSRRKNGEVYPELRSISEVRNQAGYVVNYVAVFADISRIKASERQLEFLAHHDPLTQLPNRLLLLSHLEHSIRYAQRENHRVALLMLDLDRFKDVNDSFGHAAGDELLKQVAERLTSRLRGMDTVARLGGDEFTVIMKQIAEPEDAALVATEIMRVLSKPWTLPNQAEVHIGASIGISIYPDHGETTQDLLQHADAALYQAKHDGRGRFRYFSQGMTYAARERLDMEARLHRAIEQNELRVVFQPQIDMATGRIFGAEALVRWQDPQEGLIPPARFIPIAESTGLIDSISEWVLRRSCEQGKQWLDAGLPRVSMAVNISPRLLQHDGLIDTVARILAETGFPASCLELELTESALMERNVVDLLNSFRALGVRLAIDDFGTGYSSLAYLKRFPLDVLKIDKGFVDDIPHGTDRGAIAAAIVAMGHTLGFKVLAEGVENEGQLVFLKSLGCDMFQGYLASKPVSAEVFETLLAQAESPVSALLSG